MRFITFQDGGQNRAGVVVPKTETDEAEVLDLAHADFVDCLGGAAPDLLAMIEAGLAPIAARIATLTEISSGARLRLDAVTLLAPIPEPPRIIGAAHNYTCALAERKIGPPDVPVLFEKHPSTVVGPGAPVVLPEKAGGITYEAELAVVIGRLAHNVSVETAQDHVAGYTLFNDVSASEIIKADGGFKRGKNFPSFGPMGPWLATSDEINPVAGHRVSLEIDGTIRQDGSTADLLFGVAELISYLSHQRPLAPGTVIATGTPAGVAPVQNPPTWLEAGTVMTVAIEGLGQLSNPVESEVSRNDR